MDITEIRQKKLQLGRDIRQLMVSFYQETGVHIRRMDIDITAYNVGEGRQIAYGDVNVDLDI